jgi:hypothetical protein
MIQFFNNPLLLDYVAVALRMSDDEKLQLAAMCGGKYDVDGIAAGNYMQPGHKWVMKDGERALVVGGYAPVRPGVFCDWMLSDHEVWTTPRYWRALTRFAKGVLDTMLSSGQAHRLECLSLASRTGAHRWYRAIGLRYESCQVRGGANGEDVFMFSRVN